MNAQQETQIQRRTFLKGTAAAVSLAALGIADKVLLSGATIENLSIEDLSFEEKVCVLAALRAIKPNAMS